VHLFRFIIGKNQIFIHLKNGFSGRMIDKIQSVMKNRLRNKDIGIIKLFK
jgi:hypothetical protein